MGLFSNNKKPCPICGEATPRLLATKIADHTPICSNCGVKISMVDTRVSKLTVEELRDHLVLREENKNRLENDFRPTRIVPIGFTKLNIDEESRLFTLPLYMCGDVNNPPLFLFDELVGYELHDDHDLIESFHQGDDAPQFTSIAYAPRIHFSDRAGADDKKPLEISRGFKLILYLTNPCWDKVESNAGSVRAREFRFHEEYLEHLANLRPVTAALSAIMGAGTAENAQSSAKDTAEAILKFKELLDGGIITQEEFDAKKKQLLGI